MPTDVPTAYRTALEADPEGVLLHLPSGAVRSRGEVLRDAERVAGRLRSRHLADGSPVVLEFTGAAWPLFVSAYLGAYFAGVTPVVVPAGAGELLRYRIVRTLPVRLWISDGPGTDGGPAGQGGEHGTLHFQEPPFTHRPEESPDVPPADVPLADVRSPDVRSPDVPSADAPAGPPPAEYLATSGSTGLPKIVPVSHRNRLAHHPGATPGAGAPPRVTALAVPPGSNAAQTVLAEALLTPGGGLACLGHWSPPEFVTLVERTAAGAVLLAPAMAHTLVRHPSFSSERLAGVRSVRLGMAPAFPGLVDALAAALPSAVIRDVYTTTEAWPAGVVIRSSGSGRPASRPLPGTLVRVVDATGAETPAGTAGHIQLAYAPDGPVGPPYPTTVRWVDTGDLGTLTTEGVLELLGREQEVVTGPRLPGRRETPGTGCDTRAAARRDRARRGERALRRRTLRRAAGGQCAHSRGYDHAVGVRGGNLSAGQRQLAVAYEDVDFFRRVRQAGANLAYEPAASVGHDHRETLAILPAKVWSYGVHSRAVGRVSGPWSALRGFVRMHSRPNDQLRGALKDDIVRRRPVFALLDCYLLACSLWQFLPHLLHDQGFEWTVPADGFGAQGAVLTLAEDGLRYAWVCVAGAVPSMDCAFAVAMDGLVPVPDERYLSMTAALLADARPADPVRAAAAPGR
ncbi:AMP-binding protein [Streptomyces sp. CG4]|uniref:AMP-binding protein n=1 Tax=Streptomyces sp. CG4 TaxID=408783 RepID=UPI0034E1C93E